VVVWSMKAPIRCVIDDASGCEVVLFAIVFTELNKFMLVQTSDGSKSRGARMMEEEINGTTCRHVARSQGGEHV
jgi:hypothetical protein